MPRFAHPVEQELARLYDEYGVAWQYEPHTFVLERDREGHVREAFTPDFYLPELGLYVECTVARQPLTSRKRRKVRKARERAGLTVEILFRRDFVQLARRLRLRRLEEAARPPPSPPRFERAVSEGIYVSVENGGGGDFWVRSESPRPGTALLVVHGDADLHTAPELRERLTAAIADGATELVIDLSDCTFLDSMSLGVLLGATKRMRARNGQVLLVVSRPDVRRIFEITMLDRVFRIEETRDDALAAG